MKRTATCLGVALVLGLASLGRTADEPKTDGPKAEVIELWPGKPPGENGTIGEEVAKTRASKGVVADQHHEPDTDALPARADKNTGVAIVVCPGGGYNNLAWDHEGTQVAKLAEVDRRHGRSAQVPRPAPPDTPKGEPPIQALMDAQRAMSLVRRTRTTGASTPSGSASSASPRAATSARGSTNYDKRSYEAIDATDKVDSRPDFAVLVYPGGVLKRRRPAAPEIRVTSQTPPTLLGRGHRRAPPRELRLPLSGAEAAGVPVECHLYTKGGHGFGIRASNTTRAAPGRIGARSGSGRRKSVPAEKPKS